MVYREDEMARLTIKELRNYFATSDLELAEAALELASAEVEQRRAKSAKISANLAKARASKGKGKQVAGAQSAASTTPATVPAQAGPVGGVSGAQRHRNQPAQAQPAQNEQAAVAEA